VLHRKVCKQQKKIGNIETTSFGSAVVSTFKKAPQKSYTPPQPAALPKQASHVIPPPIRRTPSATNGSTPPPPPARFTAEPEEIEGEWAEALYDYSGDPGTDLELQAGQQVLVTERTSAEWWTGEVDGRRGLFPAAYVRAV